MVLRDYGAFELRDGDNKVLRRFPITRDMVLVEPREAIEARLRLQWGVDDETFFLRDTMLDV